MPKKILIIDDVESMRKTLEKELRRDGFSVVSAADGSDGRLLAKETRPDIILTDADMPGLDGHTLCRLLRKDRATRNIPVIIMSGELMDEKDVVAGLEGGADDYLIKPFPMKVMLARIHAVLRRYEHASTGEASVKKYGIQLDPASREVKVDGKALTLTRKEFDLLALFLANPGRVLKATFLLEAVWGYDVADYNDPHTVETHISRLRSKLGPKVSKYLSTVRGVGYKLEK
ncbi:MAG: response regulator transcription factor [Elusimicrobiota bacterium]